MTNEEFENFDPFKVWNGEQNCCFDWYDERKEEEPVVIKLTDQEFPQPLTFYFKHNNTPYEAEYCTKIYTVTSIVKFWQVFNNVEFNTLLNYGTISLQVGNILPLWDMNSGTFSNIVPIECKNTWRDICLFLLEKVLNQETQFTGVTMIVKKGKFLNVKVSTSGQDEDLGLPEYFCKPKFMMNNVRETQVSRHKRPNRT